MGQYEIKLRCHSQLPFLEDIKKHDMMKHHSFIHSQAKRERRAQLNNERSKVEGLSMLATPLLWRACIMLLFL